MKLFPLYLLPLIFSLSACSTYKQYIPAPHEMPVDAELFAPKQPISEKLVNVQYTQNIDLHILQAVMKTRGFLYKGYRQIRSEYSLFEPDIRKAAASIGASHALYFITGWQDVKEEREHLSFNNIIDGIDYAKKGQHKEALKTSF